MKQVAPAVQKGRDRSDWHERASALYSEMEQPAARLVRRAYGRAFSDHEIEDIYSNAWLGTLRALERKHAELDDDEIKSYLLTAVANHASKEMRRRKRKPVAPLEAAGSVAEVADTPEDQAAIRETGAITRDLLSSLPPRRRAVMLLRYGWGLEPSEVCDAIAGLSPRAYRKEITKGVDDLVARIKLLDQGHWCEEREPVLKAYAAGTASEDQTLQAQRHLEHCRSCSDFVGRLAGHLHDIGTSILLPGALDAVDGNAGMLDRARESLGELKDALFGVVSRPEAADGVAVGSGTRGAGAAGASVVAKVSGLGAGAKATLACAGGALAVTACVATGVVPFQLPGPPDSGILAPRNGADLDKAIKQAARVEPPADASDPKAAQPQEAKAGKVDAGDDAAESQPVLDSSTPPTTEEFGVESAAAPVGAPPAQTSSGSGSGAVAEEFGP